MHKDGWFSSRCGWGAWRVKHGWLSSSGPDAFSRSQFADLRRGLSQAGGGGPRFHPQHHSGLQASRQPRAPALGPAPPSPAARGRAGSPGYRWGGDPHLEWGEPGGDGSGFWAEPASPNPPAGPEWRTGRGSKVQGTKTAPGRRQIRAGWPALATSPGQPRAAVPARVAANRSRERASDRPALGSCGGRGRDQHRGSGRLIGCWGSPRPLHRWFLFLPTPNAPGSCGCSVCKPLVLSDRCHWLIFLAACVDWLPKHPPPEEAPPTEVQLSTGGLGLVEEARDAEAAAAAGGWVGVSSRTYPGKEQQVAAVHGAWPHQRALAQSHGRGAI